MAGRAVQRHWPRNATRFASLSDGDSRLGDRAVLPALSRPASKATAIIQRHRRDPHLRCDQGPRSTLVRFLSRQLRRSCLRDRREEHSREIALLRFETETEIW